MLTFVMPGCRFNYPSVQCLPYPNSIVAACLYPKADTRDIIIHGISIHNRAAEEVCTKHRLITDRAERHRILRAAEDNAMLLNLRKRRHLGSFVSSWQVTHTNWSCFSGTMQFFNERTNSYS